MKATWYSEKELEDLGLKSHGNNVLISRQTSIYNPELVTLGNYVRIDDFCVLSGEIEIQDFVHIGQHTGLYGHKGIKFEPFGGTSASCLVYSTTSDYSGEHLSSPMVPEPFRYSTGGPVIFEKHAFIGAGSVVLPNVILKEGSVAGAMSLVIKNLDSWTIYAGIPVKKIRERKKNLINLEKKVEEYLKEHKWK